MIRGDIAIKALDALTEQAQLAVRLMSISSTSPSDLRVAKDLIDGAANLLKDMLRYADDLAALPQALR